MSFLKTLLIFVFVYLAIRYLLGRFWRLGSALSGKNQLGKMDGEVKDTIVACPTCGTYNPMNHAHLMDGNFYCNVECYHKRK